MGFRIFELLSLDFDYYIFKRKKFTCAKLQIGVPLLTFNYHSTMRNHIILTPSAISESPPPLPFPPEVHHDYKTG